MSKVPKLDKQIKIDQLMKLTSRSRSPSTEPEAKIIKKEAKKIVTVTSEDEAMSATESSSNTPSASAAKNSNPQKSALADEIQKKRHELYESVAAFKFNKNRVRVLSNCKEFADNSKGILYWMSREQRVQDNWSLLYAQKLSLKQNMPLYVCFCLVPSFLGATYRSYHFMIEGLKEVKKELDELQIPFYVLEGQAKEQVTKLVEQNNIGGLVCDFSPLRVHRLWTSELVKNLPQNVPVAQVDGHNVVPCWHASDKCEVGARTIRTKITSNLPEYFTEFPPVVAQTIKTPQLTMNNGLKCFGNLDKCFEVIDCDRTVKEVKWAVPGYTGGIGTLQSFIQTRLRVYDTERNDPNKDAQSNLSPWLHYGHVSAQRCCLEVKKYSSKYSEAVKGFLEEAIVRRELADNFCYYQKDYDNINGAAGWVKETLQKHAKDKRPHTYTRQQLDDAKSADPLWNAAQIQMRVDGKMHGFLRMYWAKKILEWTESPEQALEYAIYFNDRYNLDGRDPSGYVGCMWSICGTHDQGWGEREVFGKVRYMNYAGCKRKFDVSRFEVKYSSKRSQMN